VWLVCCVSQRELACVSSDRSPGYFWQWVTHWDAATGLPGGALRGNNYVTERPD